MFCTVIGSFVKDWQTVWDQGSGGDIKWDTMIKQLAFVDIRSKVSDITIFFCEDLLKFKLMWGGS